MTRATLLSLLAHPANLAGPDVRALEELAQAFPYCQTAHLLLAKAAHDQDSMLAAQRLRRAATYATDRARLRQLMELRPVAPLVPAEAAVAQPVLAEEPALAPAANSLYPVPEVAPAAPARDPAPNAALEDKPGHVIEPIAPVEVAGSESHAAEAILQSSAPQTAASAPVEETLAPAEAAAPAPAAAPKASPPTSAPAELPAPVGLPAAEVLAPPAAPETTAVALPEAAPEIILFSSVADSPAAISLPAWLTEEEIPAQAPPIRPPVEVGTARFEFGLAVAEPAEIIAYRLPELDEPVHPRPAATPKLPPFNGAPDIHYAPEEGSRLGFCLVAADAAFPLLPGSELPPTGEFFAPDALLLDYLAAHPPAEPPKPSSLELINSFLQRAPLATRRRAMPSPAMPGPEQQADLSLLSTRAEPDLASENLAMILARQGKNERAIAVYEKLMTKYPDKIPYFAAQIESLRP